jgi:hypothetical protein
MLFVQPYSLTVRQFNLFRLPLRSHNVYDYETRCIFRTQVTLAVQRSTKTTFWMTDAQGIWTVQENWL